MSKTIVLDGYVTRKEATAAAALSPGHLIKLNTAGKVLKHATAGGTLSPSFAVEYEYDTSDIATAYATGDRVRYVVATTGARIKGKLAASAAAIVIGDYLESAGDGTLRKVSTDTATSQDERNSVRFQAVEAVNNSSGSSEVFIKVEVI